MPSEMPSLAALQRVADARLINEVCSAEIAEGTPEMISLLENQMDIVQVACKLLSLALKQRRGYDGPEEIGLTPAQIARMNRPEASRPYGRGYAGGGGGGGGNRRGRYGGGGGGGGGGNRYGGGGGGGGGYGGRPRGPGGPGGSAPSSNGGKSRPSKPR